MDPISSFGIVVGVAELVTMATKLTRRLWHLRSEFGDLMAMTQTMQSTQTLLRSLQKTIGGLEDSSVDEELRCYLGRCSVELSKCFAHVDKLLTQLDEYTAREPISFDCRGIRILYVSLRLSSRLEECAKAEALLRKALPFVELKLAQHNSKELASIKDKMQIHHRQSIEAQSNTAKEIESLRLAVSGLANKPHLHESGSEASGYNINAPSSLGMDSSRNQVLRPLESRPRRSFTGTKFQRNMKWLPGIQGCYVKTWSQQRGTYEVAIKMKFSEALGHRVILGKVTYQQNYNYWTNLSILPSLGIYRLVHCQSDIWIACDTGNLDAVKFLMLNERKATPWDTFDQELCQEYHLQSEQQSSPYCRCVEYRTGDTLLNAAVRSGNIALVRFLLDEGVKANALNENLRSPLFEAFKVGQPCMARLLIGRKADVDQIDADGQTVIHVLTDMVTSDFPKSFKGPKCGTREHLGLELLELAVCSGFEDLDGPSISSRTHLPPLHSLLRAGAATLSTKLLAMGATGLMHCYSSVHSSNDGIIVTNCFHAAAEGGDLQVFKRLRALHSNLDIDCRNHGNETPLHRAVASPRQNAELIKWLLGQGADPRALRDDGQSVLSLAALRDVSQGRNSSDEVLRILANADIDLNETEAGWCPALHRAAANFNNIAVELLLTHLAPAVRLNLAIQKNSIGYTPLHTLALTMSSLTETGTDSMHEIESGDPDDCLYLLLVSGADIEERGYVPPDWYLHPLNVIHEEVQRAYEAGIPGQYLTPSEIACRKGNAFVRKSWCRALKIVHKNVSIDEDGTLERFEDAIEHVAE